MKKHGNENIQVCKKDHSALEEYQYEIKDKWGFFSKIFYKLKNKKNQLLLNPGKDERRKSSDLMWRVAGYKSNVFDKFDNLRNKNHISKSEEIIIEVVGKNNFSNQINVAGKKIEKLIIPKNIKTSKNEN